MRSVVYTVEQLISLGAHIGNSRFYWDSSMYVYTLGLRKDIVILNMRFTVEILKNLGKLVVDLSRVRGRLLFFFSLVDVLIGRAFQYWLDVEYFSGLYIGGFISNLRKIWSVLRTVVTHGREFYTSITSFSFAPDCYVSTAATFGMVGIESAGVGSLSIGMVDTDMTYGKFLYSLPMNDKSNNLRFFFLRILSLSWLKGRLQERSLLLQNSSVNSKFLKNCMLIVRTISLVSLLKELYHLTSFYILIHTYYCLNFSFSGCSCFLVNACTVFLYVRYLNSLMKLFSCYKQNLFLFSKIINHEIAYNFLKLDNFFLLFFFTQLKHIYLLLFFLQKRSQLFVIVLYYLMLFWYAVFKEFSFLYLKKFIINILISFMVWEDLSVFFFVLKQFVNYIYMVYLGNLLLYFEYIYSFVFSFNFFIFNYLIIEDFLFFFFESVLVFLQDEINYVFLQELLSFSFFHFMKKRNVSFLELRQSVVSQLIA